MGKRTTYTGRAASKEQFYVSASRGRFSLSVYTDDKDYLLRSVQQSSKRMTASELSQSHNLKLNAKGKFKDSADLTAQKKEEFKEDLDQIPKPIPPPYINDKSKGDNSPDLSL